MNIDMEKLGGQAQNIIELVVEVEDVLNISIPVPDIEDNEDAKNSKPTILAAGMPMAGAGMLPFPSLFDGFFRNLGTKAVNAAKNMYAKIKTRGQLLAVYKQLVSKQGTIIEEQARLLKDMQTQIDNLTSDLDAARKELTAMREKMTEYNRLLLKIQQLKNSVEN